jgi:xylulokinase
LSHLLVLDVGSSALKAALFDRTGTVRAAASAPIATQTAADRSAEQSVDDWWQAALTASAKLPLRDRVTAVALTGSMQNLIALSEDGWPAGPAILYSDRRLSGAEVEALRSRLPVDYASRTGNRLDPAHPILKIMRLDRYLPTAVDRTGVRFLFGAKDAVIRTMTGKMVIDPTTAATTGLFSIRDGRWDSALVAAAGIAPDRLPDILSADAVAGHLLDAPAAWLGLRPGIPVFNGAGDGAAATWGALADRPASAYVYIGTTGWVAATMTLADVDPPRDIYTLADPIHGDRAILLLTFGLTILVDLTVAIGVGVTVASLLFMMRMSQTVEIAADNGAPGGKEDEQGEDIHQRDALPLERDEADVAALPRLVFRFNLRNLGRLRLLIYAINLGSVG